jgi:hypothetical protein
MIGTSAVSNVGCNSQKQTVAAAFRLIGLGIVRFRHFPSRFSLQHVVGVLDGIHMPGVMLNHVGEDKIVRESDRSGLDRFHHLPYPRAFHTGQNSIRRARARRPFAPNHQSRYRGLP